MCTKVKGRIISQVLRSDLKNGQKLIAPLPQNKKDYLFKHLE